MAEAINDDDSLENRDQDAVMSLGLSVEYRDGPDRETAMKLERCKVNRKISTGKVWSKLKAGTFRPVLGQALHL